MASKLCASVFSAKPALALLESDNAFPVVLDDAIAWWDCRTKDGEPVRKAEVGKQGTQRQERTKGIVRQQTGRWHRQQNKFAKVWEQTKVTTRLVVGYFNWMWEHSRLRTTAAQRAGLADDRWTWNDLITYPTVF